MVIWLSWKSSWSYLAKSIWTTLLATEEERAFALTGLWYRISDKISRWKNLLISNRAINNEPLTDTYQDIVNYGIIAQLVERGLWKK
jgi:hypothetical protein